MILTYRSILNPHTTTMTVVPDNRSFFLKGWSLKDALLMVLYVDNNAVDCVLVASGPDYDALFADIPDREFSDEIPGHAADNKATFDVYSTVRGKREEMKNEIFGDIYNEVIREIKAGDELIELEIIIPVCIAHLIKKVANKDL